MLKTIKKCVNLFESNFFPSFQDFPLKIRVCLLKKMPYLLWLTGGFSHGLAWGQFTRRGRKNCVCSIWCTLSRCLRSCQNHLVEKWRERARVYFALSGGCH